MEHIRTLVADARELSRGMLEPHASGKLPPNTKATHFAWLLYLVEARRIELLSETISSGTSPGAAGDWSIPLCHEPSGRLRRPVAS